MKRLRLIILLGLLFVIGCGYGEVSPTTYDLAKSIYSISNRKLASHVPKAKTQIDASLADGKISEKEAKWLEGMIADAEQERWDEAMKAARRVMEDQVGRR